MSLLLSYLRWGRGRKRGEKSINLTNWFLSLLVIMMEIYGSAAAHGLKRWSVVHVGFKKAPTKIVLFSDSTSSKLD